MQPLIGLAVLACVYAPPAAVRPETAPRACTACPSANATALTADGRRLLAAAMREGSGMSLRAETERQDAAGARTRPTRWISRHPALFGALVGAGAGALAAGTMENELFCSGGDEDCLFHGGSRLLIGAGMGAGIGALIGWIGSF